VGTRELLDVESAQNDYLAATQQLLVAKYEYIAGLLDLEYALNVPRDEFLGR
jgi:outer membrane protein TolC